MHTQEQMDAFAKQVAKYLPVTANVTAEPMGHDDKIGIAVKMPSGQRSGLTFRELPTPEQVADHFRLWIEGFYD